MAARKKVFFAAGIIAGIVLALFVTILFSRTSLSFSVPFLKAPVTQSSPPIPITATTTTPSPEVPTRINIGFVGDIVPGATYPSGLFDATAAYLETPDVMIGNLEGVLRDEKPDLAVEKCPTGTLHCFAFGGDKSFAKLLRVAGFEILNIANNHSNDFGAEGQTSTLQIIRSEAMLPAGEKNGITFTTTHGVVIGIVSFSTYKWTNNMDNQTEIETLVGKAAHTADIVVVVFHAGAEGLAYLHTPEGREYYLGENRGDVRAFAHSAIAAGADLVLGSGPHVLRSMEWYQGKLIAYSLGNFASAGGLSIRDFLKSSAILTVSFDKTGAPTGGTLVPIELGTNGIPAYDPEKIAIKLVNLLSRQDFENGGVTFTENGELQMQ